MTEPSGELRRGWTTGACATAAAAAAYEALLTGRFPDPVTITLPGGQAPAFALAREALGEGQASAAIVKDAGDDPDVTHGALVRVTVRATDGGGVTFRAGEGVGTVTLPGLALAVGEPAINPGPRRMLCAAIAGVAAAHGGSGDVAVEVAIPGGEKMAERTLNGRLGIRGGLSILGTTGIVVPFSCASWIASIQRGIDVARAAGLDHVAAATGSTSAAFVQARYALSEQALIDMGDFAGGMLKYLRRHPVARLTIAGGFAKLAKLAHGELDLHSARSRVDMAWLAGLSDDPQAVAAANSANEALQIAGTPLANRIAALARQVAQGVAGEAVAIEILICDRQGKLVGRCPVS
jgi:cobalt-precorrin-5B (C1)-methyltransferase